MKGTNVIDLTDGSLVAKESAPFGESQTSEDYTTNADLQARHRLGRRSGPSTTCSSRRTGPTWTGGRSSTPMPTTSPTATSRSTTWRGTRPATRCTARQAGFIRNNVPVISSVTVGTDLERQRRLVDAGEKTTVQPREPDHGAQRPAVHQDQHVDRRHEHPVHLLDQEHDPGRRHRTTRTPTGVATINIAGKFGGDGTGKIFTVKITDAVGIVVQQTVDGRTSTTSTARTRPSPSRPSARLPTSWTGTASPVAGHIEAIGISTYDNAGTTDADVSGTVMVRGTAHDNVRIDAITLSHRRRRCRSRSRTGASPGSSPTCPQLPHLRRDPDGRGPRRRVGLQVEHGRHRHGGEEQRGALLRGHGPQLRTIR